MMMRTMMMNMRWMERKGKNNKEQIVISGVMNFVDLMRIQVLLQCKQMLMLVFSISQMPNVIHFM